MYYYFFDYKQIYINNFNFNATILLLQKYKKYELILLNEKNILQYYHSILHTLLIIQ